MDPNDPILVALLEIRDDLRQFREEREQLRDRSPCLHKTEARVDRVDDDRTVSEIRLKAELDALAEAVREVRNELRHDRALRASK